MWNSCCSGPAPGALLSGLVKSLPEFPSLLKVRKSQNWISCHLFFIQCLSWSLWTKQLHGLALVPEGSLNASFLGNRGLVIFLVRKPVCARKFSACLKGRERAALMSPLPSIPCRSTGTASNPNSDYCLCKLRVRSPLSREIAGTSTQSSRIYKQLRMSTVEKRAFGPHVEEYKREWQTKNENPAVKGNWYWHWHLHKMLPRIKMNHQHHSCGKV